MSKAKARGRRGGKSKRAKKNELAKADEWTLYISLEDGNSFPGWFTKSKDGYLQLPMSKRKGIMTIDEYRNMPDQKNKLGVEQLVGINQRQVTDTVTVFKYDNERVGEDLNYVYTLGEIIVTHQITKQNNFMLVLVIYPILKLSRRKVIDTYLKKQMLEYEILCPIWQITN